MSTVQSRADVTVDVENVGGIEDTAVSFTPGVTVLTGRNATNRTSLLRSLMAALGSEDVALKSDADRGAVTLTIGEETYTRVLERADGRVTTSGDPYLDEPDVADLFAFLLESNEARRAVRRGADLRELVMRPVDTAAIREEIDRLEAEKRRVDEQIADLSDLEDRLADLETERSRLQSEIDAQEARVADKRAALDELDASATDASAQREKLEAQLSTLEEARSDLERARTQLETERASLDSLRDERADLDARWAELPDDPGERLAEIDGELTSMREHKRSLESTITQLGQVIQFNESVVDGERESVLDAFDADDGGDLTDQLLESDDTVVCWTCGTAVETSAVEDTLASLRSLRQERVAERRELSADIDALQEDKRDLESVRSERERIDERLAEVDAEIDRREENVEHLESAVAELETRVDELETAVAESEEGDYDEVLDAHRAVNEAEFALSSLEDDLAETAAEIEQIQARLDERSDLQARRTELSEALTDQRTRIDRLEADVVETFNEHMAAVLSLLDYENIERIWIERRERESSEGRGTTTDRVFDLHVVRGGESGAAYEDTVETLSESEREVAGLVFALAGYLAHDLHETVPFMLLDSLEAIDAARIADLVDYFADHAPYLVVALLEEDAAAVDAGHERIEMG